MWRDAVAVGTFDPGGTPAEVDGPLVQALLAACDAPGGVQALAAEDVTRFAPVATHQAWEEILAELALEQIEELIRIVTQGEDAWPEWQAGSKSSVIAMVRYLKGEDRYNAGLTD